MAQAPGDFAALEATQNAANSQPGPRSRPQQVIPVPQADLSPAAQALVGAPYRVPAWDANPPDAPAWRASPICGDFHGFPPAILTSGTRDLFLSNTVRTHRKLRQASVEAQLQVFEGFSHAQYLFDPAAPETKEAFSEIAAFFDKHLSP